VGPRAKREGSVSRTEVPLLLAGQPAGVGPGGGTGGEVRRSDSTGATAAGQTRGPPDAHTNKRPAAFLHCASVRLAVVEVRALPGG
jgi:hypothetical protein